MTTLSYQDTMERLLLLIRAGYPVIYIVSAEERRVLDNIARIVRCINSERQRDGYNLKHLVRWYADSGLDELLDIEAAGCAEPQDWLTVPGLPESPATEPQSSDSAADAALRDLREAEPDNMAALSDTIAVFFDIHPFLTHDSTSGSGNLVRPLRNAADGLRRYYDRHRDTDGQPYKTIIIVAPSAAKLSPELERDLIRVDFPLPERRELQQTLSEMLERCRLELESDPSVDELAMVLDDSDGETRKFTEGDKQRYGPRLIEQIANAGRGLTLEDYRSGLYMFGVRRNRVISARYIEDMLDLKAKDISNPALQYTPHVQIDLGGLEAIKTWIQIHSEAASSTEFRQRYRLPPPRGLMLIGVSGGGKSQLAKLVASKFKLALLRLDVGALFGSYIGESEERTQRALALAEVLAPVVLWIDEIDKAFRGIGDGGDNGVSARVLGYFLTWLAEKKGSVFVVTTANDFEDLFEGFPELGRKGRFDEIFWVDLPDEQTRKEIFRIYLKPEIESGYLTVTDDEIDAQAATHKVAKVEVTEVEQADSTGPDSPDPNKRLLMRLLDRLCAQLSKQGLSEAMTGAEIEYAVTDAKYRASQEPTPGLTVAHLAAAVADAKRRAMYRLGSTDADKLKEKRDEVKKNGWLSVK